MDILLKTGPAHRTGIFIEQTEPYNINGNIYNGPTPAQSNIISAKLVSAKLVSSNVVSAKLVSAKQAKFQQNEPSFSKIVSAKLPEQFN